MMHGPVNIKLYTVSVLCKLSVQLLLYIFMSLTIHGLGRNTCLFFLEKSVFYNETVLSNYLTKLVTLQKEGKECTATALAMMMLMSIIIIKIICKAFPLQARCGPEGG